MRGSLWLSSFFLLGPTLAAYGQGSCSPDALATAAKRVAEARRALQTQAVPQADPHVPPVVARQLADLKDALASAAQAAFACAPSRATADQLQATLATALHANVASATETVETLKGKDIGAYGSDLSVQVFPLFGKPKFFEVDFRYGVECGDDNLLMIFESADDNSPEGWRERLRWGAPSYSTVGDAIGDFVMLTPLTGSYQKPTWRFLVAHGHPGCATGPRQSLFDLDLLSLSSDPAKPHVDWHFQHAYAQDQTAAPRLSTTEDTVDFRILHQPEGKTATTSGVATEIYRFHLSPDCTLEPSAQTGSLQSAH